jgi:hypothetical protein
MRTEQMIPSPHTRLNSKVASADNRQLQRGGCDADLTTLSNSIGRLRWNEAVSAALQYIALKQMDQ